MKAHTKKLESVNFIICGLVSFCIIPSNYFSML